MKIAIIGSRNVHVENDQLAPLLVHAEEIVSGGACGVDACAAAYARKHHMKLTEFLPDYKCYGRAAPIVRNKQIVDYADRIIAFWDGASKGTLSVINYAKKVNKPCQVILLRHA